MGGILGGEDMDERLDTQCEPIEIARKQHGQRQRQRHRQSKGRRR